MSVVYSFGVVGVMSRNWKFENVNFCALCEGGRGRGEWLTGLVFF